MLSLTPHAEGGCRIVSIDVMTLRQDKTYRCPSPFPNVSPVLDLRCFHFRGHGWAHFLLSVSLGRIILGYDQCTSSLSVVDASTAACRAAFVASSDAMWCGVEKRGDKNLALLQPSL
jgi:hypothetical protein